MSVLTTNPLGLMRLTPILCMTAMLLGFCLGMYAKSGEVTFEPDQCLIEQRGDGSKLIQCRKVELAASARSAS